MKDLNRQSVGVSLQPGDGAVPLTRLSRIPANRTQESIRVEKIGHYSVRLWISSRDNIGLALTCVITFLDLALLKLQPRGIDPRAAELAEESFAHRGHGHVMLRGGCLSLLVNAVIDFEADCPHAFNLTRPTGDRQGRHPA